MSTHKIEVVRVHLEPHPNADSLSVVRIYGYTCCTRTADWQEGALAAYIPPDYTVPTDRPEFAFLASPGRQRERIKVKRLRGTLSMGLLVQAPVGLVEGDCAMEALGVERYEPPMRGINVGGVHVPGADDDPHGPSGIYSPKYDVESWHRYGALLVPGEMVVIREKIHGANARYLWHEDRMWCGSRTVWKRVDADTIWHRALAAHPGIETLCRERPGQVVYGEVYGRVQDLNYGVGEGVAFTMFDILNGDEWLAETVRTAIGLPQPAIIYHGPYNASEIERMADGPSLVPGANHIREGIVIRPMVERRSDEIGRVQLKCISASYLARP